MLPAAVEKDIVPVVLFGLVTDPVAVKTSTVLPTAICEVGEKVIPVIVGADTLTVPLKLLMSVTCTLTDVARLLKIFTGGDDTTDNETGSAAANDSVAVDRKSTRLN